MEGVGREIRLKPNKCGKKKTIKPKQQKNVLYAAVWHFQSEGPNERGEGNTNSKSTGGNQDKGANNTDIDGIYGTKTKSGFESLLK